MEITKIALDSKSSAAASLVKELCELSIGSNSGRIEVAFDFVASKGADETYTAVQELCPWTLVAVLLSKINGVTQQVVVDSISQIMGMSDAQRKIVRENLKDSTTARLEEMGLFVQRPRSGKTRIEITGEAAVS